jgi:glycosyltransferase involved in cell wall biosynthesis
MKILYVQQHFATNRGEAAVRGYNFVKTLADRGNDVTVICGHNWRDSTLAPDGRRVLEQEIDGLRIVQLAVFYSNKQSFLRRVWSFMLFGLLACREVLRRDADLVFASSTPLTVSIPALCARWLKGTPYVFEVRDLWPDLPIEMGIVTNPVAKHALLAWEWVTYRWADKLVALAPGIREGIQRKAKIPDDRIVMIPNGSDTKNLRALGRQPRELLPVDDGLFLFGFTGTHGLANGLDAVLDAAAVLKRRGQSEIAFALVGDGREKPRLVERARDEGLDNVHFVGLFKKAEYNRVLCELDVGLQILANVPAFYYGTSPNKFFDYLAAGRPVLVNYPGWMSDLVTEARCGIAVPPDDPEAFADACERFYAERATLDEMGRRARRLAEEEFSQQKILVELSEFVEGEMRARSSAAAVAREAVGEEAS